MLYCIRRHFESAEVAAGFQLSVIGVLGFRTVRQVEPKAQMVLVANTSSSSTSDVCPSINQVIHTHDSLVMPLIPFKGNPTGSDLVEVPSNRKSSRQDEMQRWDMAPYIEAIDSQQSSCFILKFFCDLLRIRWESTRSRTKGRALEMMDKLVMLQIMMPAMKKLWKFRMISQLELRSLARSAYNRGEYETSKILWEAAMALNSLHMIKKKSKEAFIAFKEALRWNGWQLWENYGHVALDVGNIGQAINCSFEKSSASACAKVKEMGHVLMYYAASIWEIADVFNLLVFVYQALLIMSHYIRGKPGTLFVGSRDKYI
ncbi:TPR REGION domain-containing protein [Citrus sinensis]|uniref:TPR REGION domain-containing protein n=1 Tax=Citrus sinensis TaxID=2711 RepID=A0ACB8LDU5_CITSI|nr:TPR REGION domain-containing protein [Citrus sinensis]